MNCIELEQEDIQLELREIQLKRSQIVRCRFGIPANCKKPLLGIYTGKGAFTIVDEATGKIDSSGKTGKWGLLKSYQSSRNGWICLAYDRYTEKI